MTSRLAWLSLVLAVPAAARGQDARRSIVSISVCAPAGKATTTGSCPAGSADSARPVLGPGGGSVNAYGGLAALADEHSTILPPGTLHGRAAADYLFFAASQTQLNQDVSGLVVLTGGSGPDRRGQWTLDYARHFGLYAPDNPPGQRNGQVFLPPTLQSRCPPIADGDPAHQDPTFDLNYANAGTVVVDPTNPKNSGPGRLLMVYEGTNRCLGLDRLLNGGNSFYSTLGVATSTDEGATWPTYRQDWQALPGQNATDGPEAPLGALGSDVCVGNDCTATPPAAYGRYAVLGPPLSVSGAMAVLGSGGLPGNMGDSEPSAFVDDVAHDGSAGADGERDRFLYVVNTYNPGSPELGVPRLPNGAHFDLVVARARLDGGLAPLEFRKWNGVAFDEPGLASAGGGSSSPIFATVDASLFASCRAPGQTRSAGSISYVDETRQYLLTFVCRSPGEPATGSGLAGAAWFYSTIDASRYDLSHQEQWSTPREIAGSWSEFRSTPGCADAFAGWYPSFMSLARRPGHLSTSGFVFYLDGCLNSVPGRAFSSRAFTITTR